ncbi:MAG: hypothetical protein Q7S31_01090 [bacterium]|nr:hypothetical protein [bacterium]
MTLGDATAGLSNIALNIPAGATYAPDAASTISFISTSATQQTVLIDSGYTAGKLTFNSASNGNYAMTAAITTATASTVTHTKGTLHTDGATDNGAFAHSWGLFTSSSSSTRTLTLANSSITIKGATINFTNVTGLTMTANTATFTITGANGNFTTGSQNYNGLTLVMTGGGSMNINNGPTFATLTVTGTAVKTNSLGLRNVVVTGTATIQGDSAINRLFVVSQVGIGTAASFTVGTIVTKWADWRDINALGAANWDLTAQVTDSSGDAGGNPNITFTTADDNFWIGGTGNWSTAGEWSTTSGGAADGRVPLPQDDVYFDNGSFSAGSQSVTQDMPRAGKNITWCSAAGAVCGGAVTNTPAWAKTTSTTVYGSVKMISGMTESGATVFTFEGRGAFTFTSAGKQFSNPVTMQMIGGSLTLQDASVFGASNQTFTLNNGTFDANNFNVTMRLFSSSNSNTRAITMGTGTWTLTSSGTIWTTATIANLTFSGASSIISMTDVNTNAKAFAGGGLTFGSLSITSDGTAGITTFTGANTWTGSWTIGAGGVKSIVLPGSTTTTITASSGLGNGTNVVTFTASAGSATISSAAGNFCWDYVSLTNIPSTGGATFYAGANSTDGLGNTGWSFTACPAAEEGASTSPNLKVKGGVKVRGGVKFR